MSEPEWDGMIWSLLAADEKFSPQHHPCFLSRGEVPGSDATWQAYGYGVEPRVVAVSIEVHERVVADRDRLAKIVNAIGCEQIVNMGAGYGWVVRVPGKFPGIKHWSFRDAVDTYFNKLETTDV